MSFYLSANSPLFYDMQAVSCHTNQNSGNEISFLIRSGDFSSRICALSEVVSSTFSSLLPTAFISETGKNLLASELRTPPPGAENIATAQITPSNGPSALKIFPIIPLRISVITPSFQFVRLNTLFVYDNQNHLLQIVFEK